MSWIRFYVVTASNLPTVFEAFETISHDGGGRAGWTRYHVPEKHQPTLRAAEKEMSALSAHDLETFCIGEQTEQEDLRKKHSLKNAQSLLAAFFDSGWRRE